MVTQRSVLVMRILIVARSEHRNGIIRDRGAPRTVSILKVWSLPFDSNKNLSDYTSHFFVIGRFREAAISNLKWLLSNLKWLLSNLKWLPGNLKWLLG